MFKWLFKFFKREKTRNYEISPDVLELIGKNVKVDIMCYDGGIIHPEYNILMEITDTKYVFKSIDENFDEDLIWEFPIDESEGFCDINRF